MASSPGTSEAPRLGDILCRRGALSPADLQRTLAEREPGTLEPLGALLRRNGLVTDEALAGAVDEKRRLRERVLRYIRCLPRLGEILRRRGLVDESELSAALDEQAHSWEALGAILLRRGRLKTSDLEGALHDQQTFRECVVGALATVPRLGELLCHRGLVTEGQVQDVLAGHRTGEWLGQELVRRGLLRVHDLVDVLVEQHRLRNAALVALVGVILALQPGAAVADELGETSAQSVQISLTIPQRIQVVAGDGAQNLVEVAGAAATNGLAAVAALTPVRGPAHIEIRGSGPDGALVATGADGALLPYHVDLHDPLTGDVERLETGEAGVELSAMPSIIEIGFDGLTPAETAAVVAGGTLLVMVSPQI